MILDKIVKQTIIRIEAAKVSNPKSQFKTRVPMDFAGALRGAKNLDRIVGKADYVGMAVIAEIKKASPSKGIIDAEFQYLDIAKNYQNAGATAISVLTEPDFFMGSNTILSEIRKVVELPILRKDFTIDEYQIYEALSIGADAILLIAAVLQTEKLREFLKIASALGLSAIVETHDEHEVESALLAGAEIIGVNNRNLKTFEVDLATSLRLRKLIPKEKIFISESGIETAQDIGALRIAGVDAVLIGETFMKAKNKAQKMRELFEGVEQR